MSRLVFMGSAEVAVPSLHALHEAGHSLVGVVTQPDRPRGRGGRLAVTPVCEAALPLGLTVLKPEKASDPGFINHVCGLAPELIAVVAYGQILRPALLEVPPLGCVNVHGSLLPALRGAAPVQWAVIHGLRETGVTTMLMDRGMDTGAILLQCREPIEPDDTAGSLASRLAPRGAVLLVETIELLVRGRARPLCQDSEAASYAPPLRREEGTVCWDQPALAVRNRILGCNPAPGAYTRRRRAVLKLWRAESLPAPRGVPPAGPGTVLAAGPELVVAAADGAVRLLEVQPESRSRLPAADYVRGYGVQAGERWSSDLPESAPA